MRLLSAVLLTLAILSCRGFDRAAQAADTKANDDTPRTANSEVPATKTQAYLGLGIAPLHRSLISHLLELIGDNRGVLVAEVVAGSPADEAGLEQDDILLGYDDQKVYAPEQLIKLVQNDQPGREVTLETIHAGKRRKIKVTLGEQQIVAPAAHARRASRWLPEGPLRRLTEAEREARWGSFDSMSLSRVGDDQFKAEIKYRDDNGKIETHTFQGTREELRNDIEGEKDLPANERNHLLRSLDLARRPFDLEFPVMPLIRDDGVLWDF